MESYVHVGNKVTKESIQELKEVLLQILNNASDSLVKAEAIKLLKAHLSTNPPNNTIITSCSFSADNSFKDV